MGGKDITYSIKNESSNHITTMEFWTISCSRVSCNFELVCSTDAKVAFKNNFTVVKDSVFPRNLIAVLVYVSCNGMLEAGLTKLSLDYMVTHHAKEKP